MPTGLVTIGRRQYVVGLYWENSPGGSTSQAAREAARQPGQQAQFFTVRGGTKTGRIAQFGLAFEEPGLRYGMPVLAACLANQQPGSWAGAFRLREGIVVIVVRDDLILPDGDQFFQDENEARERLLQEMGFGGLQRVYAPEAWSLPGADGMPLSLLLNDRTDIKLSPVEIPKNLIVGGVAVFVLLVLALGVGWYYQDQKEQEETDRLAHVEAMQKARDAARKIAPVVVKPVDNTYPEPVRVWEKKPKPLDIIMACKEGFKKVPVTVVGWTATDVRCDGSRIVVSWVRTRGYASLPEHMQVVESGLVGTQSFALTAPQPRGYEELINVDSVTRRILAQNWGGQMQRTGDDPVPPPPDSFRGKWNPPPVPWVKRSFTLDVPVLPWSLKTFFADFPGIVVTGLHMPGIRGPWTVEGVIYENRR